MRLLFSGCLAKSHKHKRAAIYQLPHDNVAIQWANHSWSVQAIRRNSHKSKYISQ